MTIQELRKGVNKALRQGEGGDIEGIHLEEDGLMCEWIRARATPEELEEWNRLWGSFDRWYS